MIYGSFFPLLARGEGQTESDGHGHSKSKKLRLPPDKYIQLSSHPI
jgi:hypothetical protein